jgi:hypothetical protein
LATIFAEHDEEARQIASQVREDLRNRDLNPPVQGEEVAELN